MKETLGYLGCNRVACWDAIEDARNASERRASGVRAPKRQCQPAYGTVRTITFLTNFFIVVAA